MMVGRKAIWICKRPLCQQFECGIEVAKIGSSQIYREDLAIVQVTHDECLDLGECRQHKVEI